MIHQDLSRDEGSWNRPPTTPAQLDWRSAHEELSRLAKSRARLDWEESGSLLCALRSGAHLHLGFASFAEYIERLFGYKPRWTEERLRVAEALERLPEIDQSLRDGAINWSAARELTRVATPENQHQWLDAARGRTLRQVEEMVAGHKPGDQPSDPRQTSLARHVLRFDVSADTFATFGEAMLTLRREAGGSLDDDAALLALARHALGGPTDAGRASYQIALTVCEGCGRGWQQGQGEQIEVASEIVEMASCDVQHLGRISARPATPSPHVGLHERNMVTTNVDDDHAQATNVRVLTSTTPLPRARQDVPPAVRREIMRRDGGRCVVPGCRNAVFVDLHHLVLRSEGGAHDPDTMVVLCAAHHRAEHKGQLIIEGRVSTRLHFRHADGTRYGDTVDPRTAEVHAQAFRALRALGFREGEVRRALDRVRTRSSGGDVSTERVLREALATLSTN